MAELGFEIRGKRGEVSATTFRGAIYYALSLLREFDAAISGKKRGSINWYVDRLASNGSLSITFHSKQKPQKRMKEAVPDLSTSITSSFLNGFEDIEERCSLPSYLSEYGLERVGDLAHLIRENGAQGFRFQSQDKSVDVTDRTYQNVEKLLPIRRTSIGSVEGNLEGINLHGKPRVIIYHAITKKAVTCLFEPDEFIDEIKKYLGKRVMVFGRLFKNVNGDTLRVAMEQIKLVDEGNRFSLPSHMGQDPEFSRTKSTEEYLRSIRGR